MTGECAVFIRLDNLISQRAEVITALAVTSLYNHGDYRRMATPVGLAAGHWQTSNVCYGCNQPSLCLFAFGDDLVSPRTSSQVVRSGVPSGSVVAIQHTLARYLGPLGEAGWLPCMLQQGQSGCQELRVCMRITVCLAA